MKTTPEWRRDKSSIEFFVYALPPSLPLSLPPSLPPSLLPTEEEGPKTHAEEEGEHHVFPPLGAKTGDWVYSRRKWKDGGW